MTGSYELTNLLRRLLGQLSWRRQRQCAVLLGLMLDSAFSEVVSLGEDNFPCGNLNPKSSVCII